MSRTACGAARAERRSISSSSLGARSWSGRAPCCLLLLLRLLLLLQQACSSSQTQCRQAALRSCSAPAVTHAGVSSVWPGMSAANSCWARAHARRSCRFELKGRRQRLVANPTVRLSGVTGDAQLFSLRAQGAQWQQPAWVDLVTQVDQLSTIRPAWR